MIWVQTQGGDEAGKGKLVISSSSSSTATGNVKVGAIIGIVFGSIAAIGLGIYCFIRRRNLKFKRSYEQLNGGN